MRFFKSSTTTTSSDSSTSHSISNIDQLALDDVKTCLDRMSHLWPSVSQMRHYSFPNYYMNFDLNKPDFLSKLLPFENSVHYKTAAQEIQQKVLTCAWIIYNQKTIEIEQHVVTPACTHFISPKGDMKTILSVTSYKQIAAETQADEAFHTLLVQRAIEVTEYYRKIQLTLPEFHLVAKLSKYKSELQFDWQKTLVQIITAIVSEIFISDYLNILSEDTTVQPINKEVVRVHRIDELRHGKIFDQLAKHLYYALNEEQKAFFADFLPKPIQWFADKDIDVWRAALTHIQFPNLESLVSDAEIENRKSLEKISYTGIVRLAAELGISDFRISQENQSSTVLNCGN